MQINRCEFWDCEKILKRTENRPLCIEEISNSMAGIPEISLQFEYDDLKYIIVKTRADFEKLVKEISDFDDSVQHELIAKILIWDVAGRDF